MQPLYDFGISQEDPLTELQILQIGESDHVLSVASGGEVPLTISSLVPGVKITAVDISNNELVLCRLKWTAAVHLPFPLNGKFLGFARLHAQDRRRIYLNEIEKHLNKEDSDFWSNNLKAIENGVVNCGRFEKYIKWMRRIASLLIGKKNIRALIECDNVEEQAFIFDNKITPRRTIRYFFRLAFHPAIYKNRGLNSTALIHAKKNTGEVFFQKFRSFCTATPSKQNYFLQYFLTGDCQPGCFPEYLHENNRKALAENKEQLFFKHTSIEKELEISCKGSFTKIHLSNIGDWMKEEEFGNVAQTLSHRSNSQTLACYRFLQKNHFEHSEQSSLHLEIHHYDCEFTDRFPFYSFLLIKPHE
jgi:S-adenosylmethionine-diacylglycerol 3-amino-3-carboxypropyl transferase